MGQKLCHVFIEQYNKQWRTQKKTSVGAKHMSGGFSLANSKDFKKIHTNMHRFYTNSEI
jgi:hypothetical protein